MQSGGKPLSLSQLHASSHRDPTAESDGRDEGLHVIGPGRKEEGFQGSVHAQDTGTGEFRKGRIIDHHAGRSFILTAVWKVWNGQYTRSD